VRKWIVGALLVGALVGLSVIAADLAVGVADLGVRVATLERRVATKARQDQAADELLEDYRRGVNAALTVLCDDHAAVRGDLSAFGDFYYQPSTASCYATLTAEHERLTSGMEQTEMVGIAPH
jgi:hypothetical protein